MSQSDVEKIKERLGIKEVIESYIKVEKAGKNFKARCPFHNEKTPSFVISPERENYYCFGCGAKGDIFTFVEKFEGIDFSGALKILADRAGIKLENQPSQNNSELKLLKDILEEAAKYFEFNLQLNGEAIEYLKRRGLSVKIISDWRIGFSKDGWNNLLDFLKSKNYKESDLEKAGLIKKGGKGNFYDTFRSRIMFPIFNSQGEVVAFTGRIFGEENDAAKYLNSPESIVFKKSEILYGFDKAKSSIRKNDFTILVEGQMDTIMAHQIGYTNTVASSGTALTDRQLEIINRISPKIVIAYDSDSAGFKAAQRAWQIALELGMDVKIAPLKEGTDPADLIKENILEWKETIKKSKHLIEVLVDKIKNDLTIKNDPRKISQSVNSVLIPYVSRIKSKVDQSYFVKFISDSLNIDEESIKEDLKNFKSDNVDNFILSSNDNIKSNHKISNKNNGSEVKNLSIEKRLFGILFWQESTKKPDIDFKKLREDILEIISENKFKTIAELITSERESIIFNLEEMYNDKKTLENDVPELLSNLKIKYLSERRNQLLLDLKKSEYQKDEEMSDQLLKEIGEISTEIQNLNQNK